MEASYIKDIILAVLFFLYPFFLLILSKGLDRTGVRKDWSRKLVHILMGLVILVVPLFDHLWIAMIPPIIFTLVNYADLKLGIFAQISGEDQGNIGTVLYPISYIILMWACFGTRWWGLAELGILTMAFGDAAASLVGREFGKRKYKVSGELRSYAGSGAMFIMTFIVATYVCIRYGADFGMAINAGSILGAAFIIAGIATVVEALSIKGTDNITVPLLTALGAYILFFVFMPNIAGNQTIVNQPYV
jgi:phytol kinase